jgi:hypothetical protein
MKISFTEVALVNIVQALRAHLLLFWRQVAVLSELKIDSYGKRQTANEVFDFTTP